MVFIKIELKKKKIDKFINYKSLKKVIITFNSIHR